MHESPEPLADEIETRVNAAIAQFLECAERGQVPRRTEFLAAHADLAGVLTEFLDDYEALNGLTPNDRTLTEKAATLTHSSAVAAGASRVAMGKFGDYELLEEVARGGMGVIYRARQVSLGRIVAIKMVLSGLFASSEELDRFQIEAGVSAQLDHPGIVPIFEIGQWDGHSYFAMAFVEGTDLAARLAEGPMPPREAAALVAQIARAVQYAHDQGVVHRDLKPSNILIDRQGRPRVTDFGLAKRVAVPTGVTTTGQILGTPAYIPPEQALGRTTEIGPLSDVYGLCVLLYTALTGRPPFQAASPMETLRQVIEREPAPPRQLNDQVPLDLETIVLRCLEKSSHRRYSSAREVAEELDRFTSDRPILARAVGRFDRGWRWCRRNPVVAGLLAAVAASLMVGTAVSAYFAVSERRRADSEAVAKNDEQQHRIAADQARLDAREQLARTLVSEAGAMRRSRRRGQKTESLARLKRAIAIWGELRGSGRQWTKSDVVELRTEIMACSMLPDLEVAKEWPGNPPGTTFLHADSQLKRYVRASPEQPGHLSLRRIADDVEVARIPGQEPLVDYATKFSPDARYFVRVLRANRVLEMWKIDQLPPEKAWKAADVGICTFSPNGRRLAIESMKRRVQICDAVTGRIVKTIDDISLAGGDPWDVDSSRLALRSHGELHVVDAASGDVLHRITPGSPVHHVCWHPTKNLLAMTCSDLTIRIFDLTAGRYPVPPLVGHGEGIYLTFNRSGDVLASSDWSGMLRLWDAVTGRQIFEDPAIISLGGPHFAADDKSLGCGVEGDRIRLFRFSPADGMSEFGHRFSGYGRFILSHNGTYLAVRGAARTMLLDASSGAELAIAGGDGLSVIEPLAFEPDDRALVTFGDRGILRWPLDATGGKLNVGPPRQLLFSGVHESWGTSADTRVMAEPRFNEGATVFHLDAPMPRRVATERQPDVRHCSLSPDGRWLVAGSHVVGTVTLWDSATGRRVRDLQDSGGWGTFSSDGRWLAVGRFTGGGQLWDVSAERLLAKLPGNHAAFSPDGNLVAVGGEFGIVRLIACPSGREIARLELPEQTRLLPRTFAPDGGRLFAFAAERRSIFVWDLAVLRRRLREHGLDWDTSLSVAATIGAAQQFSSALGK